MGVHGSPTLMYQLTYLSGGTQYQVTMPSGQTTGITAIGLPIFFYDNGKNFVAFSKVFQWPERIFEVTDVQFQLI